MAWPTLLSVFLVGLLGGVHCIAMCGGLAIAVEQRHAPRIARLRRVSPARLWWETLLMHAGRITTYAVAGAVAGALGQGVWRQQWLPVQRGLIFAGSVLLCAYGLAMLARAQAGRQGRPWRLALIERGWGRGWQRIVQRGAASPAVTSWRARLAAHPLPERYATGLAWGMMPCGMTLSVMAMALLAGSAASGAMVMLAFGLGTLPNLMALSGLFGALRRIAGDPRWRGAAAMTVIAFGIVGVYRAVVLPDTVLAQGFCLVW